MVRQHDVNFQRSASTPETNRDSELERLKITYALSGNWEDIRMLIHDIETGPDFVVIDNVALGGQRGRRAVVAHAGFVDVLPRRAACSVIGASGSGSPPLRC